MNTCVTCKTNTLNPKFCCRKCAAISNNSLFPKRRPTGACKECSSPISSSRVFCKTCYQSQKKNLDVVPIEEAFSQRAYQRSSRIRDLARNVARKAGILSSCAKCGYDKHVETCHIHPISEFPLSSTIGEVNSLLNLVGLCPNCHWELDAGFFKVRKTHLGFPEFEYLHSTPFDVEAPDEKATALSN